MSIKRYVAGAIAVAALAGGIVGAGATPAAADCNSPIVMFFSYGATVNDVQVAARSTNPAAVGCLAGDVSGATVDLYYVLPGATFAKARHTDLLDTSGSIVGLGANWSGSWPATMHTIPTDFYAESPFVPMDPSALGSIRASAAGATVAYRTYDR